MADLNDVTSALVTLIAAALYPNGTSSASAITANVRIFAGWPKPAPLDKDLAAGIVNVSVYPRPNAEQNTTRYQRDWQVATNPASTITATVATNTVTLGGTVTVGNYVSVIVDQKAYSYAAVGGDTLTSIAAALAALINADWPTTTAASGVITLPAKTKGLIIVRVAAPGTAFLELKRQRRGFSISIWAPSNALRAACAAIVDPLLAATDFLTLADQTRGWLMYDRQNDIDDAETESLYRRDLYYFVEYATTQVAPGYPVTIPSTSVTLTSPAGDTPATVTNVQ